MKIQSMTLTQEDMISLLEVYLTEHVFAEDINFEIEKVESTDRYQSLFLPTQFTVKFKDQETDGANK